MFLIGQSIDIHKIKKEKNYVQKLGGIECNLNYKIIAHSDGDIILHAISESILGALGLEDIGSYFPDNNSKNKNLNSLEIINFCLNEMKKKNMVLNNIDLMIISEHIFFTEIKSLIKDNLIVILNTKNISVKATRPEDNKKKIQCSSIVLLKSLK